MHLHTNLTPRLNMDEIFFTTRSICMEQNEEISIENSEKVWKKIIKIPAIIKLIYFP